MNNTKFTAPADKLLTVGQMTAKMARKAEMLALRALVRNQVANELGGSAFDAKVIREANRRIRGC